jgi:hypothetical protein
MPSDGTVSLGTPEQRSIRSGYMHCAEGASAMQFQDLLERYNASSEVEKRQISAHLSASLTQTRYQETFAKTSWADITENDDDTLFPWSACSPCDTIPSASISEKSQVKLQSTPRADVHEVIYEPKAPSPPSVPTVDTTTVPSSPSVSAVDSHTTVQPCWSNQNVSDQLARRLIGVIRIYDSFRYTKALKKVPGPSPYHVLDHNKWNTKMAQWREALYNACDVEDKQSMDKEKAAALEANIAEKTSKQTAKKSKNKNAKKHETSKVTAQPQETPENHWSNVTPQRLEELALQLRVAMCNAALAL